MPDKVTHSIRRVHLSVGRATTWCNRNGMSITHHGRPAIVEERGHKKPGAAAVLYISEQSRAPTCRYCVQRRQKIEGDLVDGWRVKAAE